MSSSFIFIIIVVELWERNPISFMIFLIYLSPVTVWPLGHVVICIIYCVPDWSFCPNPFLWEMQFQYYLYRNFLLSCLVSSQPTTDKRLPDSEHPSCSMQVDISSNPEVELAVKVWVQSLALGLVSSNLATPWACAYKEFLIHRSSVVSHIGHASTTWTYLWRKICCEAYRILWCLKLLWISTWKGKCHKLASFNLFVFIDLLWVRLAMICVLSVSCIMISSIIIMVIIIFRSLICISK